MYKTRYQELVRNQTERGFHRYKGRMGTFVKRGKVGMDQDVTLGIKETGFWKYLLYNNSFHTL